jgi:mannitol/fructose-specific phosphotransferase system IIA component (Ntr-type)
MRMIHITDLLEPPLVLQNLQAASKADLLGRIAQRLHAAGRIPDADDLHRRLLQREALMTTGVRSGFAFPHAFDERLVESFLAVALVPQGVDYDSLDGEPVQMIFMLLGPPSHHTLHLRILARVSRIASQPGLLETLRETRDPALVMEHLAACEEQLFAFCDLASGLR